VANARSLPSLIVHSFCLYKSGRRHQHSNRRYVEMVCSLPSLTLSFFLVLQTLCAPTWSNPVNPKLKPHVVEDIALGPRQAIDTRQSTNPPFRVTGVRDGGPPQPRLEIRQLQQEPDQWNLYLLALDRMQKADQSNELSYYQIAGQ